MVDKLSYRNTKEEDYLELCKWWKWHRFPAPKRKMLPNDLSSGIMVTLNGNNVCAGFIYATSSSCLFHCEFVVSNPEIKDRKIRKEAILFLIRGLVNFAKMMGAEIIYTSLINENLINTYLECGFVKGSKGATEMIYTTY